MHATCPAHLILLDFIALLTFDEAYKWPISVHNLTDSNYVQFLRYNLKFRSFAM